MDPESSQEADSERDVRSDRERLDSPETTTDLDRSLFHVVAVSDTWPPRSGTVRCFRAAATKLPPPSHRGTSIRNRAADNDCLTDPGAQASWMDNTVDLSTYCTCLRSFRCFCTHGGITRTFVRANVKHRPSFLPVCILPMYMTSPRAFLHRLTEIVTFELVQLSSIMTVWQALLSFKPRTDSRDRRTVGRHDVCSIVRYNCVPISHIVAPQHPDSEWGAVKAMLTKGMSPVHDVLRRRRESTSD